MRPLHLSFTLCALLALSTALGACGDSRAAAAANDGPAGAFRYAMNVRAAGDEQRLWVHVTGRDSDDDERLVPLVFERGRAGAWRTLPQPPVRLGVNGGVSLAAAGGRPCAAYSRVSGSTVLCFDGARWRRLGGARDPLAGQLVTQLAEQGGRLLALAQAACRSRGCGARRTLSLVYRWDDRAWRRRGDAIGSAGGIAQLGTPQPGQPLQLSIGETGGVAGSPRTVYRLAGDRWERVGAPLDGLTIGPSVSGPQQVAGTTWLAVNEANRDPWRFSVYARSGAGGAWRQHDGRPLNVGPGHAQGAIADTGSRLWASWSEEQPHRGRFPFAERLYAAPLDPAGGTTRPIELRAGLSIGPPDLQVVCGAGRTWAVYQATTRWGGFDTRVRALARGC